MKYKLLLLLPLATEVPWMGLLSFRLGVVQGGQVQIGLW